MKVTEFFLTIYFWSLAVICILVTYFTLLVLYPFISQKTFSRIYEVMIGYAMLYLMLIPGFWSFKITDYRSDKSWEDKRFVMVANHLSFIDSLISSSLPVMKKFMIAKIFTQIPIFGWLTRNAGFVHADRNKPEVNKNSVNNAVETIRDGSSFFIYPLGYRQLTPNDLGEFKTGAFRIAKATGLPILPITIKNTEKGMRFGAIVGFADLEMIIDEPFYVHTDDYKSYANETKRIISSRLDNNKTD